MAFEGERRSVPRFTVWFPVRVVSTSMQGSALAHNISQTGILVATRKAFEVGSRVEVSIPLAEVPKTVKGRVVRSGQNAEDPQGLWPYKVAIDFDAPDPTIMAAVQ